MWVCRTGKDDIYKYILIEREMLYFPWESFNIDLSKLEYTQIKSLVKDIKKTENETSLSNWSGQLNNFVNDISIGDYVIVPMKKSSEFMLLQVIGEYEFDKKGVSNLHHRHKVKILIPSIPKQVFDINTWYSLRAYRTIFKVRDEKEVLESIRRFKEY